MACGRVTFLTIFLLICALLSANGHTKVIELNENNWKDMLNGEWMVEFYAPWCPACKGLESVWNEYATWSDDIGIKVAQVDVTNSPGLSGRFMVTALPTIFHVINGEFRQYKGTRDKDSFITFVEEKKWTAVEAIPGWKSPTSLQMSVVSSFFRLSQVLRHIHNQLMEDFGLPQWGSYLIFAVATIFLGALLGLILVCCLDLVYPPKCSTTKLADSKDKKDKKGSGDELDDDDIKDDLLDDASQSDGEKNSQSDGEKNSQSDSDKNSQSDGEKNSQSESDSKNETPTQSNTNSPKIKKRKPRKE